MQEGYLTIQGKKIWYAVYGEQTKKTPLLVVHGGPGFHTMTEVISDFCDERPVYFYDQLGGGKSDLADDKCAYTMAYYVSELEAVITGLQLEEVILMGFSWGGGLVSAFMLEKKPRNVKALILSSPYLGTPMFEQSVRDNLGRMSEWVQKAIKDGDENYNFGEKYQMATIECYKKYYCNLNPIPESIMKAFSEINEDVYQTLWGPSEFTINGTLKNCDFVPRLHELTVPVLLTCGDSDAVGVKPLKDCQLEFHNACLAVVPNATHMHQLEKPEIYKTIICDFIKAIE